MDAEINMGRSQAVANLAEALWSTERALDDAFGELADLLGTVTRTRQEANFAMVVGQDAVNEIAAALPEMTVVRDRLIEAHRRLERWQKRMGVDVPTMGTGADKPSHAALIIPAEPLREVA